MTHSEFLLLLKDHPQKGITLKLPDDTTAPAHFHITEIGACAKDFIDCGGKPHSEKHCVLQVWVADDYDHRIEAGKLARILELSQDLFPDPQVEVEFEIEAPVLTRLPIKSATASHNMIEFTLLHKKADCLAKDICLPKRDFSLPKIPSLNIPITNNPITH